MVACRCPMLPCCVHMKPCANQCLLFLVVHLSYVCIVYIHISKVPFARANCHVDMTVLYSSLPTGTLPLTLDWLHLASSHRRSWSCPGGIHSRQIGLLTRPFWLRWCCCFAGSGLLRLVCSPSGPRLWLPPPWAASSPRSNHGGDHVLLRL